MITNYSHSTVSLTSAQPLHAAHAETSRSRKIFYISMAIFTGCLVGCIFGGIWYKKALHHYRIAPNSSIWSSHHWQSVATLSAIGIVGGAVGMSFSGSAAVAYSRSAFPDSQTRIVDRKHAPALSLQKHEFPSVSVNQPSIN